MERREIVPGTRRNFERLVETVTGDSIVDDSPFREPRPSGCGDKSNSIELRVSAIHPQVHRQEVNLMDCLVPVLAPL